MENSDNPGFFFSSSHPINKGADNIKEIQQNLDHIAETNKQAEEQKKELTQEEFIEKLKVQFYSIHKENIFINDTLYGLLDLVKQSPEYIEAQKKTTQTQETDGLAQSGAGLEEAKSKESSQAKESIPKVPPELAELYKQQVSLKLDEIQGIRFSSQNLNLTDDDMSKFFKALSYLKNLKKIYLALIFSPYGQDKSLNTNEETVQQLVDFFKKMGPKLDIAYVKIYFLAESEGWISKEPWITEQIQEIKSTMAPNTFRCDFLTRYIY